ncbi:MAG TPA: hypothetical protein VMR70_16140 [Flavisolibacter sp.]|nr:hypothetical protein [Flavisolibacter sp.]
MSSSSLVGLVIGSCFAAVAFLIRVLPIESKWIFTIYTRQQRAKAIRYISRMFWLFAGLFCIVALLPLLIDFRGLRWETFVVLAIMTLSSVRHLTRKHFSPNKMKSHL